MLWRLGCPILQTWSWTWVVAELVNLPAFPHSHCGQRGALKHCLGSLLIQWACSKAWGQLSCSQFPRPHPTYMPVLQFCPGEVQDHLSQLLQRVYIGEGEGMERRGWSTPVCCPGWVQGSLSLCLMFYHYYRQSVFPSIHNPFIWNIEATEAGK